MIWRAASSSRRRDSCGACCWGGIAWGVFTISLSPYRLNGIVAYQLVCVKKKTQADSSSWQGPSRPLFVRNEARLPRAFWADRRGGTSGLPSPPSPPTQQAGRGPRSQKARRMGHPSEKFGTRIQRDPPGGGSRWVDRKSGVWGERGEV